MSYFAATTSLPDNPGLLNPGYRRERTLTTTTMLVLLVKLQATASYQAYDDYEIDQSHVIT